MAKIDRSAKAVKKVYLTPGGLVEAKNELEFLVHTKRAEVSERIQRARDFGDVTENSEYDAALEEQTLIENRIGYLEDVLSNAQIIDEKQSSDFVVIGSTVKIEMGGEIDEFEIVGKVEANPLKKKISNESPLGSSILGLKVGEVIEVSTPIVKYKAKVLHIK